MNKTKVKFMPGMLAVMTSGIKITINVYTVILPAHLSVLHVSVTWLFPMHGLPWCFGDGFVQVLKRRL